MNGKLVWGIAVSLIAPWCAGCATSPGVIRGQSPATAAMAGPGAPGMVDPAGCPGGGCPDGACDDEHCLPKHRLWYHYCPPENACGTDCSCWDPRYCFAGSLGHQQPLVYPPNPTPGAIVQYPYYTCKGPDDFFYPPISQTGPGAH